MDEHIELSKFNCPPNRRGEERSKTHTESKTSLPVIPGVSRDLITLQVGIPAYAGMTREGWNDMERCITTHICHPGCIPGSHVCRMMRFQHALEWQGVGMEWHEKARMISACHPGRVPGSHTYQMVGFQHTLEWQRKAWMIRKVRMSNACHPGRVPGSYVYRSSYPLNAKSRISYRALWASRFRWKWHCNTLTVEWYTCNSYSLWYTTCTPPGFSTVVERLRGNFLWLKMYYILWSWCMYHDIAL
jgi:hypothetical protein